MDNPSVDFIKAKEEFELLLKLVERQSVEDNGHTFVNPLTAGEFNRLESFLDKNYH